MYYVKERGKLVVTVIFGYLSLPISYVIYNINYVISYDLYDIYYMSHISEKTVCSICKSIDG